MWVVAVAALSAIVVLVIALVSGGGIGASTGSGGSGGCSGGSGSGGRDGGRGIGERTVLIGNREKNVFKIRKILLIGNYNNGV